MPRILFVLLLAGVAAAQPQPGNARKIAGMSVVFSVDTPLDVPGAVLQPGTYVLRIKTEPGSTGDLAELQLWDRGETSLLAELYAVQSRVEGAPDSSILTYYEGTSGRRILRAWNLLTTGYRERIVYSPEQAAELSKIAAEPVLSMPLPGAPPVATPAPVETATTASAAPPESPNPPAKFPKTAGNLSLVLWLGLTALAAFAALRMCRTDPAAAQNARNNAVARRTAAAAYRTHTTVRRAAAGKQT